MPLLQALQACSRVTASLYGPVRLRKQITDALGETVFTSDVYTLIMAMQSENAALEILKQALVSQKMKFGSGGSTLVNLCRVLLDACCDLFRQGVSVQRICSVLHSVQSVSQQACKRMRLPAAICLTSIESVKDREASEVANRIADAFLRLGSTLLENTGIEADYWSSYAHVRRVHAQYHTGLEQLGPDKFFAMCPYNASKDFALLPINSYRRMDDYQAVLHAMQQAFRVLELALIVEQYSIGGLA
ncbi:hypothetical protein Poli38472_001168 [Pythium oligandrum]|uniref:Uncharacterized protein n=1 Tax=Pythium oligandrum TaxID=41045 RepID=A0A8K1CUD5_PYTOL|nr:hypothetical protein Poli38472_001168 [Pythium oligandrum]|eukprot:TMW69012.1 hypothetical protein Poli38472_001168 [Pythium oligandrum]